MREEPCVCPLDSHAHAASTVIYGVIVGDAGSVARWSLSCGLTVVLVVRARRLARRGARAAAGGYAPKHVVLSKASRESEQRLSLVYMHHELNCGHCGLGPRPPISD